MLLLLLSCFSRVRLCGPHRRESTRLLCSWDSPGKNTGWAAVHVNLNNTLLCISFNISAEILSIALFLLFILNIDILKSENGSTLSLSVYKLASRKYNC